MIDRILVALLTLMLISSASALTPASGDILITQKNRQFSIEEITIVAGRALLFSNDDEFPHQITVMGPGVATSSPLQQPGQVLSIVFPQQGTAQVRCGIHPRMRLSVGVE